MTDYERAVAVWQKKNISTDAELAEALNSHSISFAYHSGKIENNRVLTQNTYDTRRWQLGERPGEYTPVCGR